MLPSFDAGGAERVMITLANHLDTARYDVHFLSLSDGPARAWLSPHVQVHILGARKMRHALPGLVRTALRLRPNIIFSALLHMNAPAILLKAALPHARVLVREASLPSALISAYGLKGRLGRYIYRFLYPFADAIISPARVIQAEFRSLMRFDPRRHHILFNPVDTQKIERALSASPLPDDPAAHMLRLVCNGRLTFEKGFDALIPALARLDVPCSWRLDILGEGPERARLQSLIAQHKLQGRVILHGHAENPWALTARADALVLCSLWEGMPNAALESLACGTPVLALRRAGGITDIAQQAAPGAVRLAGDMDELLRLIQALNPALKQGPAPSLLPACFTLPLVMRQFETILNAAAGHQT